MFHRHTVEKGDSWFIYRDEIIRRYVYCFDGELRYKESPNYDYDVDYKYLFDILSKDVETGPLFDSMKCATYLEYLTTCICSNNQYSECLLTFLFKQLGVMPASRYWIKFEDILEKMNQSVKSIDEIWSKYYYTAVFKPAHGDATYFIYLKKRTCIDIHNLPCVIHSAPLPARRPDMFEYSIAHLPDGKKLYRGTYICDEYCSKSRLPFEKTHESDIVEKISTGDTVDVCEGVSVLSNLLSSDCVIDVDTDDDNRVLDVYYDNCFKVILNKLLITPTSKYFDNIEKFIYEAKFPSLTQKWLKWNYYETYYERHSREGKGILSFDADYFRRLYKPS